MRELQADPRGPIAKNTQYNTPENERLRTQAEVFFDDRHALAEIFDLALKIG